MGRNWDDFLFRFSDGGLRRKICVFIHGEKCVTLYFSNFIHVLPKLIMSERWSCGWWGLNHLYWILWRHFPHKLVTVFCVMTNTALLGEKFAHQNQRTIGFCFSFWKKSFGYTFNFHSTFDVSRNSCSCQTSEPKQSKISLKDGQTSSWKRKFKKKDSIFPLVACVKNSKSQTTDGKLNVSKVPNNIAPFCHCLRRFLFEGCDLFNKKP